MSKIYEKLKRGKAISRTSIHLNVLKWMPKKKSICFPPFIPLNLRWSSNKEIAKIIQNTECVLDITDMVISNVESTHKLLKWYCKYFFHMLDICVPLQS